MNVRNLTLSILVLNFSACVGEVPLTSTTIATAENSLGYGTLTSVLIEEEIQCLSCDDNIACTFDTCDPTIGCTHDISQCHPCLTDTDCGVGGGKGCVGGNIVSSGSDGTCNGGYCTVNTETYVCKHGCDAQNVTCNECAADKDCNDGSACTLEACVKGKCVYAETDGCGGGAYKCEPGEVWAGGDACTIAVCNQSGEFEYSKPDPYCVPCEMDADCPPFIGLNGGCMDDNMLHASGYSGKCVAKRCEITYLVKSCQDNDPCTIDVCSGHTCKHTKGECK